MIFVDTSAWVALTMRRDDRHRDVTTLFRRHAQEPMLTTNHVCGETWTFLTHRGGHAVALAFLDRVESSERLEIVFVGRELEREAFGWLRRRDEREYSFVDATSFAVMRARGISGALAFDGDFAAAGFSELRA
jgi:predicted nucleic acid-binding protein